MECGADLVIAAIAEISRLDDLAARLAKPVEGLVQKAGLFAAEQQHIRARAGSRWIEGQAGFGVILIQRKRLLAPTALGRVLPLPIVPSLICCNPEEPGLKLTAAFEGIQAADHR